MSNNGMAMFDGIWPALLIPQDPITLNVDTVLLVTHIHSMLAQGCQGVAIFGTTGEAAHFSVSEKCSILDSLIASGVPSSRLMVGVGTSCIQDTVALIKAAQSHKCCAVLWHPPFYYKNLNDQGVVEFFSRCLDLVDDTTLKCVLYHFPANTGVPITHGCITQLMRKYPSNILGVKDSSFSLDHTTELIQRFPQLKIFVGKDTDTAELVRRGACGAIVALANVAPKLMRSLYDHGKDGSSHPNRQEEIDALWSIIGQHYLICSVKGIKAAQSEGKDQEKWLFARPPLSPITMEQANELLKQMKDKHVDW